MAAYDKIYYASNPIGSVFALAKTLDVAESRLLQIASNILPFYYVFEKTIGAKTRLLCNPNDELKRLQKKIVSRIFCHLKFPSYLHGGIKAEDPRDFLSNANFHAHAHVAIAIDVKDFFPSISESLVTESFKHLFRFPVDVAQTLAKLTTFNGSLPQGAPTSTYLSNLVMFEREYRLVVRLRRKGFRYSRLVDDITISAESEMPASEIANATTDVIGMLRAYGFRHHEKKYKVFTRNNPNDLMMVTGLWLNRGHPRLAKKKRDDISAHVVQLRKRALDSAAREDELYHKDFNALSGKVALLQRLGHREARRLRAILKEIKPVYSENEIRRLRKIIPAFCERAVDRGKLGYIRKFYRFQYCVGIIANSDPKIAAWLQAKLNRVRPTTTLRELGEYE